MNDEPGRGEATTGAAESESVEAPGEVLFISDQYPVPPDFKAGYVATKDGARLRYACWQATGRPLKGTVLICSGRNEFIEKYAASGKIIV